MVIRNEKRSTQNFSDRPNNSTFASYASPKFYQQKQAKSKNLHGRLPEVLAIQSHPKPIS
eukprot:scaffold961_cov35-Cyclotella_meneghiniana.AAC.2